MYVNQDDKSLAFRFQSGIQAYADTMIEQLGNHHCGPWNLLSHPVTPSPVAGECVVESLPLNLIEAYHAVGDQDIRLAKIEACYNENRPLLDGEIQDILCNSHVFKAKQVFICAPFLSDILNESAITGLLTQHLKKIIIHTDPTDRKAENIISDIEKLLKSRKNPVELIVVKKTITSVCIYLDVFCTIRGCYYRKQTVYRRDIFKLCSEVSFDQIKNEQLWLTI